MDAQKAQEKQTAAQGAGAPGQQPPVEGEEGMEPEPEAPSYSSRFTKSVNNTKILEISLDDEQWYDLV